MNESEKESPESILFEMMSLLFLERGDEATKVIESIFLAARNQSRAEAFTAITSHNVH